MTYNVFSGTLNLNQLMELTSGKIQLAECRRGKIGGGKVALWCAPYYFDHWIRDQ